jgi:hypothetical protein
MLQAKEIRGPIDERIAEVACSLVEATTPYGMVRLWIAPSLSYLPVRATLTKGSEDILVDTALKVQPRFHSWPNNVHRTGWSMQVDCTEVAEQAGTHVQMKGHMSESTEFSDGRRDLVDLDFVRKDVVLDPHFPASAFETDLPDGAEITNMDDKDSGVHYVWKDGKVTRAQIP